MAALARPVLSFINKLYPSGVDEEPIEREIAKMVEPVSVGQLVKKNPTTFMAPPKKKPIEEMYSGLIDYSLLSDEERRAKI